MSDRGAVTASAAIMSLVLGGAASAASDTALAFSDPPGDTLTSPVPPTPVYDDGQSDLRSIRLQASAQTLGVSVTTTGRPALRAFSGYDVTMRARRTCPGTVNEGAHPFEVRFRADANGAPHAIFRGCRVQISVPVTINGSTVTAVAPLKALTNVRNTTLDSVAATAGFTDSAFDGIMRLPADSASGHGTLRLS